MSKQTGAALAAILIATSLASLSGQQSSQVDPPKVPDELIVKFRPGASGLARSFALSQHAAAAIKRFDAVDIDVARIPPGLDVNVVVAALAANPDVLAVQPNYIRSVAQLPNDPYWLDGVTLWGLRKIQAPETWTSWGHGDGTVVIASLDTGVNYNHQDLVANMWTNAGEIPGNGADDDLNGYVDDVYGINTINGAAQPGNPMDDHGHGTHTAGTMAAVGNNGIGVVGVNWNAKILACKFISSAGTGTDAAAIGCLNYLVLMKNRGVNIRVSNNSWGGARGGTPALPLQNAFDAAGAVGILHAVAAGNSGTNNDATPFDPASFESPSIVAVASSDSLDNRWGSTNYGPTSVDLAAPGVGIFSTVLGNNYVSLNGTSMAAPHVAGAAALLSSINPQMSVSALKNALIGSVDQLPQWNGLVVSGGRLNVFRAAGPTITLTSPTAGSFTAPAQIPFAADASGGMGAVTLVEFKANGQVVGTDTTAPYAFTWSNVPVGTYTLTAVVTTSVGDNRTSNSVVVSVQTQTQSSETLFTSQVPASPNINTGTTWELGTRFRSDVGGTITAIRFWKGSAETGPHVGNLWSAAGALLATVTFTNETASGWQQQALTSPVTIAANTNYVVSVSTGPTGHYSGTVSFFNTALVNGHLTGLSGGNGVYGNVGAFPTGSYSNTSYFRDVVFVAGGGGPSDTTAPVVQITAPANGGTVSATTSLEATATDNVGVAGVQFQVDGQNVGAEDTAAPYSVPWNTATATNGNHQVTAIARDAAGNSANTSITVTVNNGGGGGETLFTSQVPASPNINTGTTWELGTRFRSDVDGQITAIRFWKGSAETGPHVGNLWSAAGVLLATVTFVSETASGWQQQALTSPVTIAANTNYVVSVSTGPTGHYSGTVSFFNAALVNGHLTGLSGGNGVYGNAGAFPTGSYSNTSYFRDVVFVPTGSVQTDWYVAPGGNGSGTAASPFGRIQDGINSAQPGQTVRVAPGTYNESLVSARHGAAGQPITVLATGAPGSTVVTFPGRVLDISHTHFVMNNFILDGQYGTTVAVAVRSSAHDAVLRNLEVRRSSRDLVDIGATNRVLIDGCLIHHALNPTGGRTDAHGVVASAARDLTIRNTEIHTFSGDGFQIDPGRVAPGWSNVIVEGSHIWLQPLPGPENGFAAGVVPGENAIDTKANSGLPRAVITIRNTVMHGFQNGFVTNMAAMNLKENITATVDGVTVFDSDIAFRLRGPGSGPAGAHVTAMNSVVFNVARAYRYEDNIEQLRIWNSTIGSGVAQPFQAGSSNSLGLNVRNVLILGPKPTEASDPSNLSAQISWFVSAAGHDYRLANGAPAIDAGVALSGVTIDRLGVSRPQGAAFDVGAFER